MVKGIPQEWYEAEAERMEGSPTIRRILEAVRDCEVDVLDACIQINRYYDLERYAYQAAFVRE